MCKIVWITKLLHHRSCRPNLKNRIIASLSKADQEMNLYLENQSKADAAEEEVDIINNLLCFVS